jgi:flagella basal body P-ring formation protein FlgA
VRVVRALFLAGCALAASPTAALGRDGVVRPDPSGAEPQLVVSLHAESTVRGPEIRLGDIADIQGKNVNLSERLRTISVARAPLPGLTRTLDVSYLKARLRMAQVDLALLVLDVPPVVSVTTASHQIAGSELVTAVREAILTARPEDAGRLSVHATGAPPMAVVVPAGNLELRVRTRPPAELNGTVSATVDAWVDGVLARSVGVPVRIALLSEVLVATRSISRAQPVAAEDVRIEAREVSAGQEPLRELGAVLGRQSTRAIAPGEIILASWIDNPPLVRRGDIVLLTAEGRGVRALARGEAREDGRAGQVIRVRSLTSNREVYGQVEGERAVRVPF